MRLASEFLASLQDCPGFCRETFIASHERGPLVSVRKNPLKLHDINGIFNADILADPVEWCPDGHYLDKRPVFTLDPVFHAGGYYVQESSSMFIHHILSEVLGGTSGLRALDICAAPGGKTTLLASLPYFKLILANEIIQSRVSILQENVIKWGAHHVLVSSNDPSELQALSGFFDCVLVDAPCSGSGLFRKDAQAMNEWSREAVDFCVSRQKRILTSAVAALNEGGYLLYSTCSFSKEENENNLDYLMTMGCFETVEINLQENWGVVHTLSEQWKAHGYRFYPDQSKGEGFFCSILRKTSASGLHRSSRLERMQKFVENGLLGDWIDSNRQDLFFFTKGNGIYAIDDKMTEDVQEIGGAIRLRRSGLRVGELKGNDLVPDHELAVSAVVSNEIESLEFDLLHSLDYLRKNSLFAEGVNNGWRLIKYHKLGLGWAKVVQGKIKNHYPLNWRILMK